MLALGVDAVLNMLVFQAVREWPAARREPAFTREDYALIVHSIRCATQGSLISTSGINRIDS